MALAVTVLGINQADPPNPTTLLAHLRPPAARGRLPGGRGAGRDGRGGGEQVVDVALAALARALLHEGGHREGRRRRRGQHAHAKVADLVLKAE